MKKDNKNKLILEKTKVAKLFNPFLIKAGYATTPDTTTKPECIETSKKWVVIEDI